MFFLLLGLGWNTSPCHEVVPLFLKHLGNGFTEKKFLLRSNSPSALLPTFLPWHALQESVLTCSFCATFFTSWFWTDKAITSLIFLFPASIDMSFANSATLTTLLEETFLSDDATELLHRNLLSENYIPKNWCFLLLFDPEISFMNWEKLTLFGLNTMIICFLLQVLLKSIPFYLNIILQVRNSQHFYFIVFSNCA